MNSSGLYLELRGELAKRGKNFRAMAIAIHKSYSHVCKCACGDSQFGMDEAYAALDWMGIPHSDLDRVFPSNGMSRDIKVCLKCKQPIREYWNYCAACGARTINTQYNSWRKIPL